MSDAFSEDVDVNIIPPEDQPFGSSRRERARRELQARLNTGIPLPIEHKRYGDNSAIVDKLGALHCHTPSVWSAV